MKKTSLRRLLGVSPLPKMLRPLGGVSMPAIKMPRGLLKAAKAGLQTPILEELRDAMATGPLASLRASLSPSGRKDAEAPAEGARFLPAIFTCKTGSRPYKLFVPSGYRADAMHPLIVMLHGCTQSPDDFAAGTRMNEAAETRNALVVYPEQIGRANAQRCWNWFNGGDQHRDEGEPALIAGITREVMANYTIDPSRVYVAGLSAGGAAAAIMGDAYPDLYAAIGVHSGLACGAAQDMSSAFAAMQHGKKGISHGRGRGTGALPAIILHGDRDGTVNPTNADSVVDQAMRGARYTPVVEDGLVPEGYAYRRTRYMDADGRSVIELWVVHGAGHAWFGGSRAGSYTDPRGPDATAEMLRFFLDHPRSR